MSFAIRSWARFVDAYTRHEQEQHAKTGGSKARHEMSVEIANETTEEIDVETMRRPAVHVTDRNEGSSRGRTRRVVRRRRYADRTKLHVEWAWTSPAQQTCCHSRWYELRPGDDDKPSDPWIVGRRRDSSDKIAARAGNRGQASPLDLTRTRWLLSHGILHLLGFDHAAPAEERIVIRSSNGNLSIPSARIPSARDRHGSR